MASWFAFNFRIHLDFSERNVEIQVLSPHSPKKGLAAWSSSCLVNSSTAFIKTKNLVRGGTKQLGRILLSERAYSCPYLQSFSIILIW